MNTRAQIISTIGPVSAERMTLEAMIDHQMDVARFNLSWADNENLPKEVRLIREVAQAKGRTIPIIFDLPGPRVQQGDHHTYDTSAVSAITERDETLIKLAVECGVDYIAISFVGNAEDVEKCRRVISRYSGNQRVIAKIERKDALENIDSIIKSADAVMVARGDLGEEIPFEQIPFIQKIILKKAKEAGKSSITATEMLLSMTTNVRPTRAEITDVATAIIEGSDAIMLSEETARGEHPVEAVTTMERIALEAENHLERASFNPLVCL